MKDAKASPLLSEKRGAQFSLGQGIQDWRDRIGSKPLLYMISWFSDDDEKNRYHTEML